MVTIKLVELWNCFLGQHGIEPSGALELFPRSTWSQLNLVELWNCFLGQHGHN